MSKVTRKLVPRDDRVTINHEFGSVDEFISEYVTNISRSGVFIKTKHPLDVGTKVNLKFTVIMDDLETIEGIGEVVRVSANPPGMGVVFVTLTTHSHDLIAKLITKRRAPRQKTVPGVGADGQQPAPTPVAAEKSGRQQATLVKAAPPPPPPDALKPRAKKE